MSAYSFYNQLATIQSAAGAMQGMQGGGAGMYGQQQQGYKPPMPIPGQQAPYGQPNAQPYGQPGIPYQGSSVPGHGQIPGQPQAYGECSIDFPV